MAFVSRLLCNIPRQISTAVKTTHNYNFRRHFTTPNTIYNGFLAKGFPTHCLFFPYVNGYMFRLDVPGIAKSDLRVNISGSKISVSAQEPETDKFGAGEYEPRYYEVELEYDTSVYTLDRAKVEVKNGVLWVSVSKIRVGLGDGWVKFAMGSLITKAEGMDKLEFRDIKTGQFLQKVDLDKKKED